MNIPLIGITLDHQDSGGYSKFPWYALRQNYCDAVIHAGGLPVPLPHDTDKADDYLDIIDGLVVTGGDFDVDPALFGAADRHSSVTIKQHRTDFELTMVRGALKRNAPVLGICGGQQLLHVAFGGTLIQHIPDAVDSPLAHEQPNPRNQSGHDVEIVKGTLLHNIVGTTHMSVNSAHHQAADETPDNLLINARAPDGVIEGIEAPEYSFCLGVQWHPEFEISDGDNQIFTAFIGAAHRFKEQS